MAEFKVIETQEDFDIAVQRRLERQAEKLKSEYENKYGDFDAYKEKAAKYDDIVKKDYPGQVATLQQQLSDVQTQLTAANEKISGHDETVSALTARAVAAETSVMRAKVAHEHNIPYELAERLTGANEEEMARDAETLSKYVSAPFTAPLASLESPVTAKSATESALMQVAAALGPN